MNQPLISVIIPAHNNETTISSSIDSMLVQTYRNLEIIIVDDNSTDRTAEVAEKYSRGYPNVSFHKLPYDDPYRVNRRGRNVNAGYMARNYGLEKSKGEWITFQDADDASLRNRIEAEYILAIRFNSNHVCVQWQKLSLEKIGSGFDFEKALEKESNLVITSDQIKKLGRESKGSLMRILGPFRKYIPFEAKRARIINKLFFGSLDSYPGSGNSPLFKREVIEKVGFRPVDERVWPSFTGRGADRDFNFQVSETFGQSISFKLPLYLWRVEQENDLDYPFHEYLIR
ncbi:MAG: glycosyltransferase family A protein [bacterium]|nr:glycosyltransferase family A protein [bacterium]